MEISGAHSAFTHVQIAAGSGPREGAMSSTSSATTSTTYSATANNADSQQRAVEKQQQEQQQQQEIRSLARRDREVRQHEQAHAAAGGAHAGSPQYELTKGSNGVSYATGGHVSIDLSDVPGDAQATIDKMQTVQRAALAPAQPSAQDRAVAAEAAAKATEARAELRAEDVEAVNESSAKPVENPPAERAEISAYQSIQPNRDDEPPAERTVDAYA